MEYDYIIVGAGSAGCVLADQLSRDGRSTVLLIEAGSANRTPLVRMPRGWMRLWNNPRYLWQFPVEPAPGRPANETWAYGRGLGGSSAVNGLMYFRGQPADYDQWEAQGNAGWNWREMSRCFAAIENFEAGPGNGRGVGGPVPVAIVPPSAPVSQAIIEAGRAMGIPYVEDLNGPVRLGIGHTQSNTDRLGRRISAAAAFLDPARRRPNLVVATGTQVRRVLFDKRHAIGVEANGRGGVLRYRARREVILAAGVLQSPKLLQLSGIGAPELLAANGIGMVQALPAVGRNLVEHIMVSLSFRLNGTPGLNREFRNWRLAANVARYLARRGGVMAYGSSEISAFTSLDGQLDWPEFQLSASPYSFVPANGEKAEPGRGTPEPSPGFTITGLILRPRSRGQVEIRSADPAAPPRVQPNWLSDARDCAALIAAVKYMRSFARQPALQPFVGPETQPAPEAVSDADILSRFTSEFSSGLHGTGTCRMGHIEDGVVDARLAVHGVTGLRVADCSAIPTAISSNTHGPAMAFAYRGAELILEDRDSNRSAA